MEFLSEDFWNNRYKEKNTGWDLGEVSPPLKTYFDQLTDKNLSILIPGGGNSYEAEYLHKNGFKNVYVVDLSETALENIQNRVPSFPSIHLLHSNFFDLDLKFDLIIEQTFFCALNPNLRTEYASKIQELLNENGKLAGVLFRVPLYENRPPFGGSKEEYLLYFTNFEIQIMEDCYNSSEKRKDEELFIKMIKS